MQPAHPPSSHLVISGAGRAGTSFLMALFTHLGLDTGFTAAEVERDLARPAHAGLERDLRVPGPLPYVVKNPNLCDHVRDVLARPDRRIDHLIVPLRDTGQAADSRRRAQRDGLASLPWRKRWRALLKRKPMDGGLWPSARHASQEQVLLERVHALLLAVAERAVPVTLLAYPRLVRDPAYLYAQLSPLLPQVDWPTFERAFHARVRPDWVHVPVAASPLSSPVRDPVAGRWRKQPDGA